MSVVFLLINYNLFAILKKKKQCCRTISCAISLLQESISSGFENFKASSLGSVGKLTERKWTTHMESNMVRRVTLELT